MMKLASTDVINDGGGVSTNMVTWWLVRTEIMVVELTRNGLMVVKFVSTDMVTGWLVRTEMMVVELTRTD